MVSVLIFLHTAPEITRKFLTFSILVSKESDSIIMWVTKVSEYMESEKVTETQMFMVREAWRQSKWSWKVQKLVLTQKLCL